MRVEPRADAITEELLAKVVFATLPDPLPRLGELAEVTVALAPLPAAPGGAQCRPAPPRRPRSASGVLEDGGTALRAGETGRARPRRLGARSAPA